MLTLLQPRKLKNLCHALLPWTLLLTVVLLCVGYIWVFFYTPDDLQQGSMVKVLYIHVPSAWLALASYAAMALFSGIFLIAHIPTAYALARAFGKVGIAFTVTCLITGSLWGLPTWGTWWVWDARLTSVLILLFLYLGFFALGQAFSTPDRSAKSAAVIALVGVINLPIIKWSVEWWYTLHQPATLMKFSAPSIATSMLIPLLITALGWVCYMISLVLMQTRLSLKKQKNAIGYMQ